MTGAAKAIALKCSRASAGKPLRVLDLFSGCGGLSLGFKSSGFHNVGAIESDPLAAASYSANFHHMAQLHAAPRDVSSVRPSELSRQLGLGDTATAVDVIVGGPPCQAFARVGRPKLREIGEHPAAFKNDPRAQLYLHYLEYVAAFCPLALLMENVPDVLNHGGQNVAEEICDVLEDRGYVARYTLLNAAYYGVPQMRERMFLIAYRRELAASVSFPRPTHWAQLPSGYNGTRQVALKGIGADTLLGKNHSYVEPPQATPGLPPAITALDAIGDLPPITEHLEGQLRRGARRFDRPLPYDKRRRISAYAVAMKTWPEYEAPPQLLDHVIRFLPRDWSLFARMRPGDQYPEAHRHALAMLDEHMAELASRGATLRPGSAAFRALKKQIVPPYDVNKFPNKWRKMWRDQPARTLMAHIGKDTYSHIHYDSSQARTISVREAARLQSFPDGFSFCGTMNPAFRQIGNAVPPLMAKALAGEIKRALLMRIASRESANEPDRAAAAV